VERATTLESLTPEATARLHRLVLETALDGYFLADRDGRIVDWNPEAERIFGWLRSDVVGRRLVDIVFPPEHRAVPEAAIARFFATGESEMVGRRVELPARRHDGVEFSAELAIVPINVDGRWIFGGFVRNISERKQSDEQIQRAQQLEAIAELTGGVAHDFNNLLTVIIGGIDLVKDRLRPDLRSPIESALQAAEHGATLVQRLLAFSRRQSLVPEKLDINMLVSELRDVLHRTLGERIEVGLRLAPGLWPAWADRVQLENALLHLAINARDAMPGTGTLTIETANGLPGADHEASAHDVKPGDYVMLAVSDTGSGMAPEIAARAIEPFFTTKDPCGASGLGLSMIYGFAKQSGGHLKIVSEVGRGTTIRLYLPRHVADADRSKDAAALSGHPRGDETILVVEDDDAVRALVVSQLRAFGYRVLAAADGPQAEKFVDGDVTIDLLFTDIVMPGGLTGPQLAEHAQKRRPALRALFTTGYTESAVSQQCRLGAHAHMLSKPYRLHDLARKIREVLDAPPYGPG
jgi:PAS domain S-box-containing protein